MLSSLKMNPKPDKQHLEKNSAGINLLYHRFNGHREHGAFENASPSSKQAPTLQAKALKGGNFLLKQL